jgi:hypothetical protein
MNNEMLQKDTTLKMGQIDIGYKSSTLCMLQGALLTNKKSSAKRVQKVLQSLEFHLCCLEIIKNHCYRSDESLIQTFRRMMHANSFTGL